MAFNYCPNCGSDNLTSTGRAWGKGTELECQSCETIHHVCEEEKQTESSPCES